MFSGAFSFLFCGKTGARCRGSRAARLLEKELAEEGGGDDSKKAKLYRMQDPVTESARACSYYSI